MRSLRASSAPAEKWTALLSRNRGIVGGMESWSHEEGPHANSEELVTGTSTSQVQPGAVLEQGWALRWL